ncbi:hypothetical protein H9Y13_00035 [Aeromonas veronii]|uniref:P-loop ATPase, Sll1717 family n=1 Tax=Aeromonas TaxID=642 RepID=UPI0022EA6A6A|nr:MULTISPECIES: hypothetical protein [Aeromonas]KAJ8742692.1 hypothetical protein H9Y13_00035 [Aeromonas veronii]MDA3314901.1 hypothetical protein [Aeromonas sp. PI_26]
MKKINELFNPSTDAVNYNTKENRQFFSNAYLKTSFLETATNSSCYYIVGEKGSGKSALAFHFQNSSPKGISAKHIAITETQYKRFIHLKQNGKASYTDYSVVWRATLLYLASKTIIEKNKKWIHKLTNRFSPIEKAIKDYDSNSHLPELEYVIEFVSTLTTSSDLGAEIPQVLKSTLKASDSSSTKTTITEVKTALLDCEIKLKAGLKDVKLNNDIVLFIDGLDAKPNGVDFDEYRDCLIGLSEAAWHLNTEFFPNIKDSKGRLRIVLLLRPDVFNSLNLHNSNCKLNDNSVLLNWVTTKERHRNSELFKMSDKYFLSQNQNEINSGWDYYFSESPLKTKESFPSLMHKSFQRPRDIFSAIKILINIYSGNEKSGRDKFDTDILDYPGFTEKYSEYLLGEVKNYANFYISNEDFEQYTAFFQYLDGNSTFDFDVFKAAFERFTFDIGNRNDFDKKLMSSPEVFLQFWYDVNVIGYKEMLENNSGHFYRWSYRERSNAKIMPKIKFDRQYIIHSGIAKSLNIGQKFQRQQGGK